MKRVLLDVNVVLDVLVERKPFVAASAAAWAAIESGAAEGVLAAHGLTTIHYLLRKEVGGTKARSAISAIMRAFAVAAVDKAAISAALELPAGDFEDAVTATAAKLAGCDAVVTRDPKGFRGAGIAAITPEQFVAMAGKRG